jgi:hypothetical protein
MAINGRRAYGACISFREGPDRAPLQGRCDLRNSFSAVRAGTTAEAAITAAARPLPST